MALRAGLQSVAGNNKTRAPNRIQMKSLLEARVWPGSHSRWVYCECVNINLVVHTPSTPSTLRTSSTLHTPSTPTTLRIPSTLSTLRIPSTPSTLRIPSTPTTLRIPSTPSTLRTPSTPSTLCTPSTLVPFVL